MATAAPAAAAQLTWTSGGTSHTGNVRRVNEDAFLNRDDLGLWAVADGMGGHDAGDVASQAVVTALATVVRHARPSALVDEIEDRLSKVNRSLYTRSMNSRGGLCGSTVAVLAALGSYVICLWAGDSRIYRRRDTALEQITRDHSREQIAGGEGRPYATGTFSASNIITRAVGGKADLLLDVEIRPLLGGDRFLICSDGLYREISNGDLAQHLRDSPDEACDSMLRQALKGTCSDNVTAVAVAFSRR